MRTKTFDVKFSQSVQYFPAQCQSTCIVHTICILFLLYSGYTYLCCVAEGSYHRGYNIECPANVVRIGFIDACKFMKYCGVELIIIYMLVFNNVSIISFW